MYCYPPRTTLETMLEVLAWGGGGPFISSRLIPLIFALQLSRSHQVWDSSILPFPFYTGMGFLHRSPSFVKRD